MDINNNLFLFFQYLNDQMVIPILKQAYNSSWYMNNYVYQFSYKSESMKIKGGKLFNILVTDYGQ